MPADRLTVWMPPMDLLTGEVLDLARDIKSCASLGIGPLSEYSQLETAERLDADMATTSGSIKPVKNPGILADMHTHSRNSHDASFPVLEIADARRLAA